MSEAQGRQFASNIPKYFTYMVFKGLGFGLFIAIWVIYLQQRRGLTLAQAALIDVTFFVAAAFGEIPTGMVADLVGRKTSMVIGAALMNAGMLGWTFAPTMPLIMVSYLAMGIGYTFMSGAEDALFFESVQLAGRSTDYTRLIGRVAAASTGALALGSGIGGLLAGIDLVAPYIASGVVMLAMLGMVLTLREPHDGDHAEEKTRKSFKEILGDSISLMHARPTLRYPMVYLALIPLAAFMLESVFLQPQALQLGVPVALLGFLVMATQLIGMAGSSLSDQIKAWVGEERLLYAAPVVIFGSAALLAAFQMLPALLLIGVMSFVTAALRPILMNRIQQQVSDKVRATMISMQSFMFALGGAVTQPTLASVADQAGFPTAYVILAVAMSLIFALLFWISRRSFPRAVSVGASI